MLPDIQSKGIGKALLQQVEHYALQNGQESIVLNVNRHNKALDFYRRNGFSIIAEEDIDIGNGYYMNDYLMEKPISL